MRIKGSRGGRQADAPASTCTETRCRFCQCVVKVDKHAEEDDHHHDKDARGGGNKGDGNKGDGGDFDDDGYSDGGGTSLAANLNDEYQKAVASFIWRLSKTEFLASLSAGRVVAQSFIDATPKYDPGNIKAYYAIDMCGRGYIRQNPFKWINMHTEVEQEKLFVHAEEIQHAVKMRLDDNVPFSDGSSVSEFVAECLNHGISSKIPRSLLFPIPIGEHYSAERLRAQQLARIQSATTTVVPILSTVATYQRDGEFLALLDAEEAGRSSVFVTEMKKLVEYQALVRSAKMVILAISVQIAALMKEEPVIPRTLAHFVMSLGQDKRFLALAATESAGESPMRRFGLMVLQLANKRQQRQCAVDALVDEMKYWEELVGLMSRMSRVVVRGMQQLDSRIFPRVDLGESGQ